MNIKHKKNLKKQKPKKSKSKKQLEPIQNRIYNFARSRIRKLIVSDADSSRVYALIQRNAHNETIQLDTRKFELWLKSEFHRSTNLIPSDSYFNQASSLLYSEGLSDSPRETIYNRVAMVENTLYYDLGRPDWKLLKISSDAVEIVDMDETTPTFERKQNQREQVAFQIAQDDSALDDLVTLLRIPSEIQQIFKVQLISFLLEHIPVPAMIFTGEQGSTKTTTSRTVKEIVDPSSGGNAIAFPRSNNDLIIAIDQRYLATFDNVSFIDVEKSDTLCTAITGIGQPRRKLYRDEEEIIIAYKRKIIMNGIGVTIERPDLLDRCIFYNLRAPTEDERITEEEFNEKLSALLPRIFGHIAVVLQRAFEIRDQVRIEMGKKPRFADFGVYGEAISRVLGYDNFSFVDDLTRIKEQQETEIIENHPLVHTIERIMKNIGHYEKTINDFFNEIRDIATLERLNTTQMFFPSSANRVRNSIQRISSNLRTLGYEINISQYTKNDGIHPKNRFVIYIDKVVDESISTVSTAQTA